MTPLLDATYDDRAGEGEPVGQEGRRAGHGEERPGPPLDQRDRWILEQRPPHWG